jgi:hypothetical protein
MKNPLQHIRHRSAEFDKEPETKLHDATLRELIATYPENKKIEHVHLKVVAINTLYLARVLDVYFDEVANPIVALNVDKQLENGDPGLSS